MQCSKDGYKCKKMRIALARKSMSVSGISQNTINSWINNKGKRNPTRTLGIVAKALEVDVTELIED